MLWMRGAQERQDLSLCRLENKSVNFRQAFQLGRCWNA
jgi:hypothetical protein